MKPSFRFLSITVSLILTILFSTPGVMAVHASELTPPVDPDIVDTLVSAEPAEATSEIPVTPTDESDTDKMETAVPSESSNPTEENATETPQPDPQDSITDDASTQGEIQESVSEILENIPEDTDIAVLDEDGEMLSLASQEAADTLVTGDPVWCPAGISTPTPGSNGCTDSFGTFADLISELQSGSYSGSGVIWVADSYSGNDDNQIVIDGASLPNLQSGELHILGGWNDGTGTAGTWGISDFDVSLSIQNWLGAVYLENLFINNTSDDSGFGLYVNTAGAVNLINVSVSSTTGNNDGAILPLSTIPALTRIPVQD